MRKKDNSPMKFVQSFFQDHLAANRGVSQNTIFAYRDGIKMFLQFAAVKNRKPVGKLQLDDLTANIALDFLKQLEGERQNSVITRNLRLAALRTFFLFMSAEDPLRCGEYQRIIAIPIKRAPRRVMEYLEVNEVKAILEEIDQSEPFGERDYVLLSLLHNTGARVQEICDLKVESIRFEAPAIITLVGKGKKMRHVPLWPETAELLRRFLAVDGRVENPKAALFLNSNGQPIGRFGVRYIIQSRVTAATARCPTLGKKRIGPHTFRHATAMHLLQSGVELTVIRSWLGHVNLSTTHAYIEIDLAMKRRALDACKTAGKVPALKQILSKNKDVVNWLESL